MAKKPVTLEDNVGVRVVRLAEVFARLARLGLEQPWGVSATDMRILNLLDGAGGLAVGEIARRAHVDKGWISRSVRQLEDKGLVRRRPGGADSRRMLIVLSPRGRALLDDLRPAVLAAEKRVLKGIEVRRFKADLDRLLANAEAILDDTH